MIRTGQKALNKSYPIKKIGQKFCSATENTILKNKRDPFNSVHVKSEFIPNDMETFGLQLENSLTTWKNESCKGVWIYLPIEKSSFIQVAVDQGFEYHHTKPNELVLSKWLLEGEESRLPKYTTHFAGVGGVCLMDTEVNGVKKQKMLVIKEKNGPGVGEYLTYLKNDFC